MATEAAAVEEEIPPQEDHPQEDHPQVTQQAEGEIIGSLDNPQMCSPEIALR